MNQTTVDIWGLDDVLDKDQPARIVGPWEKDPSKTILQLGESGDGLLVIAASVAGRYVLSTPGHKEYAHAPLYSPLSFIPPLHVALDNIGPKSGKFAVGILYFGPPCSWAQEQIAKAFGPQAINISHADATEEDRDFVAMSDIGEKPHISIYIGVTKDHPSMAETVLSKIETMGDLFGLVTVPTDEQMQQAASRIGTGELVELVAN